MVNNKVKIFGKRQKKRFNQILLFASALCIYPSIVLSTLSSCSKVSTTNNDLLSLEPLGKLINNFDYKDAILGALKDKEYYAKFKYALVNEIILKWYEDRADGGNVVFTTNLKQWKQEIDDEYNELVQKKKDIYGSQYQFYLQNEVLSSNGGTEKSYKHKKLVEKVRNDFINNVWTKDYFTVSEKPDSQLKFPNIFRDIKSNFDANSLNDPNCWSDIGFYAKSNNSFTPDNANSKYLASNLDGDYATIQQYVFDRWYATEKPFFVVEANFDYSLPPKTTNNGYSGLSTIYNFTELNDNVGPSEIFPCFANNDGKTFQHYQDFFKKFDRSLLSLYSNPNEDAGKKINKNDINKKNNENAIEIPEENKIYVPKYFSNGTININNFNENDASNDSLKLVLGSKLSSHTTANIMAYGSLYNDLIFASDNDEPACLNFLSWEKFSGDDELYPLSKLNENKGEKIIVFPMMKLFMLSQRKLNKFNDGKDRSKINSYLDLANIYDLISKHKNTEIITILLKKIITILESNKLEELEELLKEIDRDDELKKIIVAIKEIPNNGNNDKIISFLYETINAIAANNDKVFDALLKKSEYKEFEKIFSSIKDAKTALMDLVNDSWYDLITRDFQKNYLVDYEGKGFNNVAISWSDSYDDQTYNLDRDDLVRFVTNTIKIDLPFCPKQPTFDEIDRNEEIIDDDKDEVKYNNFKKNHQPWLFSLNNKGLNIASIDGHEYIINNSLKDKSNASIDGKLKSLKNVFKYRLMQQKLNRLPSAIKFDILGKDGQLSSYFNKNFDNIILELAAQSYLSDLNIKNCDENMNIFKSYKFLNNEGSYQQNDAFLTKIVQQQNLGSPSELVAYLINTIKYEIYDDDLKKYLNINDKIYKSCDQKIEYAKFIKANVKQKNNYKKKLGMVTPISYKYFDKSGKNDLNSRYVYTSILRVICTISDSFFWGDMYSNSDGKYQDLQSYAEINYKKLLDLKEKLDSSKYFEHIKLVKPNAISGFSPQIEQASKVKSNSFWFNSFVVDYTIHDFLSQQSDNYLINRLNLDMFDKYIVKVLGHNYKNDPKWKALTNDFDKSSQLTSKAMLSAYCVKKILTDNNSYNKLCASSNNFFTNIFNVFKNYYQQKKSSSNSSINYEIAKLYATIAYLIANDYANFYKILQKKFTDDERLFIGYFSKFFHNQKALDRHCFIEDLESFDPFDFRGKSINKQENEQKWQSALKKGIDERVEDDKYWSIINKDNKFLSGFNGLISVKANIFSSYPELKEAIFSKKNSFANKDHEFNEGIWYEYAGEYDNDGKKIDIDFDFGSHGKINLKGHEYLARIFKKISTFSLTSDLKKFVDNLNQSYNGLEKLIFENNWELLKAKYKICSQLKSGKYKKCFDQLVDVSAHKPISSLIDITDKSYYFVNKNNKSNYACLLVTQINKNDISSHNLTPIYNMEDGKWVKGKGGISPEEFFYLVVDLAMDESVQKQAHRDMRKKIFGREKIKVFDGKLYNILGSKWIKNWHKKVVGK